MVWARLLSIYCIGRVGGPLAGSDADSRASCGDGQRPTAQRVSGWNGERRGDAGPGSHRLACAPGVVRPTPAGAEFARLAAGARRPQGIDGHSARYVWRAVPTVDRGIIRVPAGPLAGDPAIRPQRPSSSTSKPLGSRSPTHETKPQLAVKKPDRRRAVP